MPGSFTERLQLVVDATTTGGERGFARLEGAADRASDAARETGESVAHAADRVAQAREREADAAGAVRVAEQRLTEVRARYGAESSQTLAAEEKLATAQRRHHGATTELERATEAQTAAEHRAARASDDLSDSSGKLELNLKGVAERAAALAGGVALGDWLRDSIGGFIDGARASAAMATSMNATVEEAGAFLGLVGSVGLELDDLIEIQAEFATKTHDGLTLLGDELQHNNDGTINWTRTLADTLTHLQGITDATERNRLGFAMFGEEGYKQLSRLLNSGVSVEDALEQIGTPFTDEDVAAVREYDRTMMQLTSVAGGFGRTLGRAVLPLLTGLVDAGQDLADVVGAIPGPLLATGAAAVILGIAMRRAGTDGTWLAAGLARASAAATAFRFTAAATSRTTAALGVATGAARAGASGLLSAFGGPWGVALLAIGAGMAVVSEGVDTFEANAKRAAASVETTGRSAEEIAAATRKAGKELAADAGAVDGWVASIRGAGLALDDYGGVVEGADDASGGLLSTLLGTADSLFDLGLAEAGATAEIERQRRAMGAAAVQSEHAQTVTKSLNDLIAEGTTSGHEFADAVTDAAQAQADQTHTTDVAEASIAAYNATTRDAIDTLLELYRAQLGQRSGWQDVLTALQDAHDATEDTKTAASEVEQAYIDLIGTVLDYGGAAADAAVEAARAAGTVLDPLTEARIRAEATIASLRKSLDAPNLTERARSEIQRMIDQLTAAQESGDIEAVLRLTGGEQTKEGIDEATEDRETTVQVESRGGPAVDRYLDGLAAARRLAIIRVETRNGPAVRAYLEGLVIAQRLALIRVESRNGPAVRAYLDSLAAQDRLAIIRVETRGGPAVRAYLDELANAARVAAIGVQGAGLRGAPGAGSYAGSRLAVNATLDLELTGTVPRAQLSSAQRGRAAISDIRAYERQNGTGWRRS